MFKSLIASIGLLITIITPIHLKAMEDREDRSKNLLRAAVPLLNQAIAHADSKFDKVTIYYCAMKGAELGTYGSIYFLKQSYNYFDKPWYSSSPEYHWEPLIGAAIGWYVGELCGEAVVVARHYVLDPPLSELGGLLGASYTATKTCIVNTLKGCGNWGKSKFKSWTDSLVAYTNKNKTE